jgi:CDGSH-type Zn-finger protein
MADDNKKTPRIIIKDGNPYVVKDLEILENSKGEPLEVKPVLTLCRCGKSEKMPYCDFTHVETGMETEKLPNRPFYKWRDYRGEKITVHFNNTVCCHDSSCTRLLPPVFDTAKRPWVNADGASPEEIIEVIKKCPSGALCYTIDGKRHVNYYKGEPKIITKKRGTLEVYGGIEMEGDGDTKPETTDHYTLCGCGLSKNHPFCDGTHIRNLPPIERID